MASSASSSSPPSSAPVAPHRSPDHVKKLVGVRHCAIGTDWEGFALYPRDLDSAEKMPRLTQALLDIGWQPEEIIAAYGGNFLRVIQSSGG
jgi:membrane dipeptidase